ncbi:hypothetical protein LIER_42155 [Lithospermum erythrorhizon]|uniref:Uncharacterized protein n=1 Tax=Lithospermum erythrorhizon TaxID=34254 RepID=A0AAV3RM21_LITER
MSSCNPSSTPIDTKPKLGGSSCNPCEDPRKSYILVLRQAIISRSSAEAKYRGVAIVVSEACWLRNLLLELHHPLKTATIVYCDNVSVIYLSENHVQHQRTKHVELDIHFLREKLALGHVRVLHVPSKYQIADIFTKGIPLILFIDFRDNLNVQIFYPNR